MGFIEEPDDGLPGIAIIGGVRKPKPGSRLAALGFKPEQDETDESGRHGTGIVGGVRRSDQGARSKLSHRFEEWDGPPEIGTVGGVRKPRKHSGRR